jgi:hypothetical protein
MCILTFPVNKSIIIMLDMSNHAEGEANNPTHDENRSHETQKSHKGMKLLFHL